MYTFWFEFLDRFAESKLEEYDQDTTTTSDFTAIYKIPEPLYENFKTNIYPKYNEFLMSLKGCSFPLINAFKIFLIDGMEKCVAEEEKEELKRGATRKMIKKEEKLNYKTTKEESSGPDPLGALIEYNDLPQDRTPTNRNRSYQIKREMFKNNKIPTNKSVQPHTAIRHGKHRKDSDSDMNSSTLGDYFHNRSRDFKIADVHFSFK